MSAPQTIILGDLSGLQDFLFDVAAQGGGQARRLRARSLFISLLGEVAAMRLLDAVGWQQSEMVFSAAGKFLLAGPTLGEAARNDAIRVANEISRWLFRETGASLRLALAVANSAPDCPLSETLDRAQRLLQRLKWQPWRNLCDAQGRWPASSLVLPPISPPCDLCRHRVGRHSEHDDNGETWRLCDRCYQDGLLGRRLPAARWLELHTQPAGGAFDVAGFALELTQGNRPSTAARHVFALSDQYPAADPRIIPHRLARHIPRDAKHQPVEFKDLAARATGSPLLGVLKLDADNLAAAFRSAVLGKAGFDGLKALSKRLDDFFGRQVDELLAHSPYDLLYMVFSGGDDLLLLGPWDLVFDFAGQVRQAFASQFSAESLTLSGGLALIKPTFPIRAAANQADDLLHQAKTQSAIGASVPKDQFAAFGQVWKWDDQAVVSNSARQLADWVHQDVLPRGWLHTLLDLAEARNRGDASPVTARLAFHIGRNCPPLRAEGAKGDLRRWANALLDDFDAGNRPQTQLLSAILRHALTATRSKPQAEP